MGCLRILLLYVVAITFIHGSRGCSINGVSNWLLPQNRRIDDFFEGNIFNEPTTNIDSIAGITPREGLNGGPYLDVALLDSNLIISTTAAYRNFENLETAQSIGFSINFRCAGGSSAILVFNYDVIDSNNNNPVFNSNNYEYKLPLPIPPNFAITNCINDFFVRDIDLTTERIDFALEGSTLFEISYDGSTVPKEFRATLRTTTFIRSIAEPITLIITATDVDRTPDLPRTTSTTVTILADNEFSLPEEPIFSQPFYIATYTRQHEISSPVSITLSQGYDSQVVFSLEGEFSQYFTPSINGNEVILTVATELDLEALQQNEIYLIVKAEREYTSGATATIILQLPEARELRFEKSSYSGTLETNIVNLEDVILNAGFDNDVTFQLTGQYTEFFNVMIIHDQNKVIIETNTEISENILQENNFLVLTLIASAPHATTASTTIFLEIIKDDYVTPVFSQNIYNGLYVSDTEVIFPTIVITQGHDETVTYRLTGDYADFFTLSPNFNNLILTLSSAIPRDVIFNEKVLLVNILAEKPRTVGANAAVALKFGTEFTEATILKFSKSTYNGQLDNGELTVEDVILNAGYTPQVTFTLNGDFQKSFSISNTNNIVKISLSNTASLEDLKRNRFVVLEIEASGERAVTVTTSVIIDIPEIEIINPVFSRPFYSGSYTQENGLIFTEVMTLQKGYDSSVTFSLEGENSQWFTVQRNENSVLLISNQVSLLPQDVLDQNSNFIFAVVANKPDTIGGRAAIHIELPKETIHLQFEKKSYSGRIENGNLYLEELRLPGVALSSIELNLEGDYSSYFQITIESETIIIRLLNMPEEVIENNNLITLNLEASRANAVKGHTTIVLDIIRTQIIKPIFEQPYYFGEYSEQEGLSFLEVISLVRGFDNTVSFELEGESSQWFNLVTIEENSLTLTLQNSNLHELTDEDVLVFTVVANKTNTESARATIVISLKEKSILFDKVLYTGNLEDNNVVHETITLTNFNGLNVLIRGEHSSLFESRLADGIVTVLTTASAVIPTDLTHITLTLHADSVSAVLVLDVADTGRNPVLKFEQTSYVGSINNSVVTLTQITLSEGYSEDVSFTLGGALETYFKISQNGASITLEVNGIIPEEVLAANKIVVLDLTASAPNAESAIAVIVLDVVESETPPSEQLIFDRPYYIGHYFNGIFEFNQIISLASGYDITTVFRLEGAFSEFFRLQPSENGVIVVLTDSIPPSVLAANQVLVLDVHAEISSGATGKAIVLVTHNYGSVIEDNVSFDKVLYNGKLQGSNVVHETITLTNYNGRNVLIQGEYSSLFQSRLENGVVNIVTAASAVIPSDLTHISLTLHVGSASAVLLLDVDTGNIPVLRFEQTSYVGSINKNIVTLNQITLHEGYSEDVSFTLGGALATYFKLSQNGASITLEANGIIPEEVLAANKIVVLDLTASAPNAESAIAVIVLEVVESETPPSEQLIFDRPYYTGHYSNGIFESNQIISLASGYDVTTVFRLEGAFSEFFRLQPSENGVIVVLTDSIPPSVLAANQVLVLEVHAETNSGASGRTVVLVTHDYETNEAFDKVLYNGNIENGVVSHETVTISGYSGTSVQIIGEYQSSFQASLQNGVVEVSLSPTSVLPADLVHVPLTLQAGRASAVLLLDVGSGSPTDEAFDKVLYTGRIENGAVSHETITISEYSGTNIQVIGAHQSLFQATLQNGIVTVSLSPSAVLPADIAHVPLTLQAGRASSVLLLDVVESGSETEEAFDKVLYSGRIENGAVSHETITISRYSGTNVQVLGVHQSFFQATLQNGVVTVSLSPSAVLPADLTHVPLTLQAGRASSVLLLDVVGSGSETEEAFDKVLYSGRIENGAVSHETITISGYSGTNVQVLGAHQSLFQATLQNGIVTVSLSPSAVLPADIAHVPLTLQAGRASTVLLLDVVGSGSETEEAFDKVLYSGRIENGAVSHETITISGYSGTNVQVLGAHQSLFQATLQNGIVTVSLSPSAVLPADLAHVPLTLQAGRADAVLLLDIVGSASEIEEAFDQVLYNGRIENSVVSHDMITISGYSGTNVQITGAHQSLFQASLQNGIVTVSLSPSSILPADLVHVPLTLQAGRASAVLLLDVVGSGPVNPPDVTFSKSSYYLWADVEQTGVVGRVEATASNNEAIAYSLQFNDEILQIVITINSLGEIFLLNSIQSGVHSFTVTATTQNSRDTATASVLLRVEALPKCDNEEGLPPLIVLERFEEQPHQDLVVFNKIYENCRYELSNSWPADQSWLYIDEIGLHTRAIDREDPSIAFMTLSQIQVELTLSCDSDEVSFAKHSLNTGILETGSFNYGSSKWILADTIEYNPRRSLVNLIVNDINDNPPIFIGKENEPIYVGYPLPELEDRILPRALIELKATDADIGENAAIIYSSSEEGIVVSPRTGFVHVRNNVHLENNSRFTVYATDLNGNGINGALDVLVKILDINQIAVITVQNAFLSDESSILNDLSNAVGYEVKVLRAVIVSVKGEDLTRTRRNLVNNADVSLQLYIYGIRENEPVDVVQLTRDITNSNAVSVNVASVLSLEDHLESPEICPVLENDVGLLIATIVLAVFLLILIVTIILYFVVIRKYKLHLKWRKNKNYDEFSDSNEDGSRSNTFDPIPKVEIVSKPRLDIEELKRSERRLQERLDIPIVSIGSETSAKDIKEEPPTETIVDIVTPVPQLPIVIQSIDKLKDSSEESDEDEFGEKKGQQRKSVVTFNENVEKIIHLEDLDEPDTPEPITEVYKL